MASTAAMQSPLRAYDRASGRVGMLNDIWETPGVLRGMLRAHLQMDAEQPSRVRQPGAHGYPSSQPASPPAKEAGSGGKVVIPSLEKPLPDSHTYAGRTPLEVMADMTASGFKNKFTIVGCGTSWHAALVAEYLIEHIARIAVDVQYASEFRYNQPLCRPGDVVVVISNSGETDDAVASIRTVRGCEDGRRVLTVAFVNVADSTIGRESDVVVEALAGAELGVASTKVFSSTLLAFVLFAVALGTKCGTFPDSERKALLEKLEELPRHVQEVLDHESRPLREETGERLSIGECQLWDMGCQNVLANNFIFLGRGFNYPIALEGAMKLKEIAYIHAEGYPAAEMKHGPIALIDQFMPVIIIAPRSDPTYEKIKANIEEVKARNGATIAITEQFNAELDEICEYVIRVPTTHEYLMPILSVIPLQLLAYMMGILRGNEVDNPRGLQKQISLPTPTSGAVG